MARPATLPNRSARRRCAKRSTSSSRVAQPYAESRAPKELGYLTLSTSIEMLAEGINEGRPINHHSSPCCPTPSAGTPDPLSKADDAPPGGGPAPSPVRGGGP